MGMVLIHTIPISFEARVYQGLAAGRIEIAAVLIEWAPVNIELARVRVMIAAVLEAWAPVLRLLYRR
ncbi:hypothetical protein [Zoogloea sp.]|uniref:hypothetical protein n=1 Tax=Zoogloea sp. TaxID=49181 RepID=UPI001415AE11|nr:MAG: hypothetical protein F9K15_18075 [Zoogloea sp.]